MRSLSREVYFYLLFLLTAAAFFPCLFNGFVWDDWSLALDVYDFEFETLSEIFGHAFLQGKEGVEPLLEYYRPLVKLSYIVDGMLWHHRAFGYHLSNLALHFANALLLLLFLRRFDCSLPASFSGALLFALHPINSQGVMWISGRGDLICSFFALLSLYLFKGFLQKGEQSSFLLALLALLAALLSKEHAAFLPLAFLVLDLREKSWRFDRTRLWAHGWSFALLLTYLFFRFFVLDISSTRWEERPEAFLALASSLSYIFLFSLGRLLLPYPPVVEHDAKNFVLEPFRWYYGFFVLLCVLLLIALFLLYRRYPSSPYLLFALLLLISFLPISNVVSFYPPVADRFLYCPSIFYSCLLALLMDSAFLRPWRREVLCVFCLLSIPLLWQQSAVYEDDVALFSSVVQESPELPLGYIALADGLWLRGQEDRAMELLEKTFELRANGGPSRLAHYRESNGEVEGAERALRRAVETFPALASSNRIKLATFLARHGREEEALEELAVVEKEEGKSLKMSLMKTLLFQRAKAWKLLAAEARESLETFPDREGELLLRRRSIRAYIELRRYEEARRELEILRLEEPDEFHHVSALLGIAEASGEYAAAMELYDLLCPAVVDGREKLRFVIRAANLAFKLGEADEAEQYYRLALAGDFAHAELRARLAVIQMKRGRFEAAAESLAQALRDEGATAGHEAAARMLFDYNERGRPSWPKVSSSKLDKEDRAFVSMVKSLLDRDYEARTEPSKPIYGPALPRGF